MLMPDRHFRWSRILQSLDRYLVWLALWIIVGVIFYSGVFSFSRYASPSFDPLENLYWTILFLTVAVIESGIKGLLVVIAYVLAPPFIAWASYRAIRWVSGY